MKSVGARRWVSVVVSVEALQSILSVARDPNVTVWVPTAARSATEEEILDSLERPRWNRLFHIYDAFKLGISFNTIQNLQPIDRTNHRQIEELIELEKEIEKIYSRLQSKRFADGSKEKGYADRQVAHLLRCLESRCFKSAGSFGRAHEWWKLVDTWAAEVWKAERLSLYSTPGWRKMESVSDNKRKMVDSWSRSEQESGGERIWLQLCAWCSRWQKEAGYRTIMINLRSGNGLHGFWYRWQTLFRTRFSGKHIYEIIEHENPEVWSNAAGWTNRAGSSLEKLNK